jgi:ATP-dependent Lon protease
MVFFELSIEFTIYNILLLYICPIKNKHQFHLTGQKEDIKKEEIQTGYGVVLAEVKRELIIDLLEKIRADLDVTNVISFL